jgi:hypothetical protein
MRWREDGVARGWSGERMYWLYENIEFDTIKTRKEI